MRPPTRHSAFFSSLQQVEKRLKLEGIKSGGHNGGDPSQNLPSLATSSSDDSSSVIHLDLPQLGNTCTFQDSGLPEQFLSAPLGFPSSSQDQGPSRASEHIPIIEKFNDDGDEIDQLMALLDLLGRDEDRNDKEDSLARTCYGGFYSKIAGVKGPKCEKEVKRLDGWIGHLLGNSGERSEPLRLAHLLLGKASRLHGDEFEGIEFPVTVEEFLENDPPT
ncbi:uncharacterized protein [Aristolochia californica]|uniref:uncharacterized protein n=1 Tax=Aristolochia californica TaxID=171875 RepID=UPI0035D78A1D